MIRNPSNLLSKVTNVILNKTFSRSHFKPPFSYNDRYTGKFDYHDQEKYPRRLNPFKEEELLNEVHSIRAIEINNPSPFHVVRRIRPMSYLPWTQKVTLRRLNLHSSFNGECVIVPNTPEFNAMLHKVKHLLQLKPARFANGKIPTEEDIGAIKVCPYTGTIKIDEKLRLQAKRLNDEKPILFRGNHLRNKIKQQYGLTHNNFAG